MWVDSPAQDRRPGLLVSVRSPAEAREALAGGATWIDVKEPTRGPLGSADPAAWEAVRAVVPPSIPFSVALGELADWPIPRPIPAFAACQCTLVKIGLAGAGRHWRSRWKQLRSPGVRWAAVAYADWKQVDAINPVDVLDECMSSNDIVGLLIDTARKSESSRLDPDQVADFRDQLRSAGKVLAIAGGLVGEDLTFWNDRIGPDWFAVRGAACRDGDRLASVCRERVRLLSDRIARDYSEAARTTSGA